MQSADGSFSTKDLLDVDGQFELARVVAGDRVVADSENKKLDYFT